MQTQLRETARQILEKDEANVVIGYGESDLPGKTMPIFITDPNDVDKLVWNRNCYNNLMIYLAKKIVRKFGKLAVVGKGCDIKAAVVLIQEAQIKREEVVIIGVLCDGVDPIKGKPDDFRSKCLNCDVHKPKTYDYLIEEEGIDIEPTKTPADEVTEIDNMTPSEQWAYWMSHFSRCIKCYACRGVCPLCNCSRCIVDRNRPQWVPKNSDDLGNLWWNIVRAFHLAGRCIQCGECTRVCPADIPLATVNKKLAMVVEENFGYIPGYDFEVKPPFLTYREEDSENFIR